MLVRLSVFCLIAYLGGCGRIGFSLIDAAADLSTFEDASVPDSSVNSAWDSALPFGSDATDTSTTGNSGRPTRDAAQPNAQAGEGGTAPAGDANVAMGVDSGVVTDIDAGAPIDTDIDAGIDDAAEAAPLCDANARPETQDTDGDGTLDLFDLDDDGDGISDIEECFAVPPVQLANSSFEAPAMASQFLDHALVPGWSTTASDGIIEMFSTGMHDVNAADGTQFTECNANEPAMIYQDAVTIPGTTLRWAFYHQGRFGADTLQLWMGAPSAMVLQRSFTSDAGSWTLYTGTYEVPAGQTLTRYAYDCRTTIGSAGNFLDAANLEPVCQLDSDGDGCPDSKDLP